MKKDVANFIKSDLDFKMTNVNIDIANVEEDLEILKGLKAQLLVQKECEHTFKHGGTSFGGCTDSDICTKCGYEYNY